MNNTILYYPNITIPTGPWLRQALLYWDEVGAIVPRNYDDMIPPKHRYTADIRMLEQEGIFRPFNPERLIAQGADVYSLENELFEILDSEQFKKQLHSTARIYHNYPIYKDKMSGQMAGKLREKGLLKEKSDDPTYYNFERHTASVYMSLLAKYLADNDRFSTIPGTDRTDYEFLSFCGGQKLNEDNAKTHFSQCWQVNFLNVLPVPHPSVRLEKIVKFRRKRNDNLLQFRGVIHDFVDEIRKCKSATDVRDTVEKQSRKITVAVSDLQATMDDSSLATMTGVVKTFFSPAPLVSSGATAIGNIVAGTAIATSIGTTLGIGGLIGAIAVSDFLVQSRNTNRQKLRDSEYSYLYLAQNAGVTRTRN